jgi:hypothetical protein
MHQVLPSHNDQVLPSHNDTALAGIDLSATRNSLSTLANALTFRVKASFDPTSMCVWEVFGFLPRIRTTWRHLQHVLPALHLRFTPITI